MFQFDEIGLGVRNGDLFDTNVSINGVYYFGVVVKRKYLGGFVEAVDETNFLLVCHLNQRKDVV